MMTRAAGEGEPGRVLVRFDRVTKSFGGRLPAVDALDLDIRAGEFLTLLGPSGSGKTTTLMMLAGFEAPSSGDILSAGKSITQVPPHKRDFGVVFQNYALFPHLTVFDNILFPLTIRRMSATMARKRAMEVLDLVHLTGFGARKPHELSGGQQQRAAVARAIVFDPVLVLMDEPFGALDKQLREQMQIEIKQIHRRLGNTMVSVTHDQSEALTISDRIAVFDHGRLQQIGTPEEVYEQPANIFVAKFIGNSNVVTGWLMASDGQNCTIKLANGDMAYARSRGGLIDGTKVTLAVRPERVAINPSPDAHANRFGATVLDTTYGGDHVLCMISVLGSNDWMIKLPTGSTSGRMAEGDNIFIGWSASDCVALT
jgi:putative spermidine/putrescine transport system ATP-binding protein